MEILGIGASELIFILLIAIIVLGPEGMQKAGKTIGRWMNRVVTSEGWKTIQDASRTLRHLPNRLMRDANLEMWEAQEDMRRVMNPRVDPAASPRRQSLTLPDEPENSIQPPSVKSPGQAPKKKPASQPDDTNG